MILRFEGFELDTRLLELRQAGEAVAIEPQVFQLLAYLVAERDRVVSREDLLNDIWGGRIVSNAAIDSRVRSVRAALGDDGQTQRLVRTVRGMGYRFVGEVEAPADPAPTPAIDVRDQTPAPTEPPPPDPPASALQRPSIAVLPFTHFGEGERAAAMAQALPHDLIAALSRLRWLFVIARASTFRFQAGADDLGAAARLGARYCLSGSIEYFGDRLDVTAELSDAERGGVIWADRYSATGEEIYELRSRIATEVVSAMELRIPMHEAERAALKPPENLDAWDAFHLGLRHIYRFNAQDNAAGLAYFKRATELDSNFARAHAGLSFAHFQNAFAHFSEDADVNRRLARAAAERAIEIDPLEPFANYVMGRADWLDADLDGAGAWLARCIDLNPNHAQGVYTHSFVDMLAGNYDTVRDGIETARALSPYDPLRYAMLITRCLALFPAGAYDEAVIWAEQAAREPNAHVLIDVIAAIARELKGDREAAERWLVSARRKNPRITQSDLFASLPFRDDGMRGSFTQALAALGMP